VENRIAKNPVEPVHLRDHGISAACASEGDAGETRDIIAALPMNVLRRNDA